MRFKIGLWLALVLIFFALYRLFLSQQPTILFATLPIVFLGVFVFLFVRNLRFVRIHNQGVEFMRQGRVVEALDKFRQARGPLRNSLPSMNIGLACLQMWRVSEAITALHEFQSRARRPLRMSAGFEMLATANLALAYALKGDEPAARQALSKVSDARETMPEGVLAELVLACRAADWPLAQRLLETHTLKLDQLGGAFRALADALTAWVSMNVGGRGGSVSSVRLYRETSSAPLKQVWPEFVEFVQRVEAGRA